MSTEAFVYDAIRTPRGRGKKGSLHGTKPVSLVVGLIDELAKRNPTLDAERVDDIVLGVVTPVGDQGMDIAKTAALAAHLPDTVGGVQLNRFCASGLEAVNVAAQKVRSGWDSLVIAGGVESMSRVPMGSDGGAWALDPETNYETYFIPQGISADLIATIEGFSREDVNRYALTSQERAAKAWTNGYFAKSVVPVTDRNGVTVLDRAEQVGSDLGLTPRARIVATATSGADSTIMLTGPTPATRKVLATAGLTVDDIDLFELNEAFAAVVLKYTRDLAIPSEKLNVNGGAIAMGHPLGATGAMLVGTVVDELERRDGRYALVTLCIGGGMGVATIIERV